MSNVAMTHPTATELRGITIEINGFPSTSLINSIVASYLVNVLNLDQQFPLRL